MVSLQHSLFYSCFVSFSVTKYHFVAIETDVGVKNPQVGKCLLPSLLEITGPDIYSCIFTLSDVQSCNFFPDNVVSLGFISISLHTSDITFAVTLHKLVCHMDINPHFLQLLLCWKSNLLPQGQFVGRLVISQPQSSLIESQNCCFRYSSKPNSVIESITNQFETPVWVDKSTRCFPLSFICVNIFSMKTLLFSLSWASDQIFKKRVLTGSPYIDGVAEKKRGLFFQGGGSFYIKNNLKSEIFNDQKSL